MSEQQPIGIVQVTCALALVIMIGWLLVIGQSIILPILIGVIAVYILTSAADRMEGWPIVGGFSQGVRRLLAGVIFLALVLILILFVSDNAQAILDAAPRYSDNLTKLLETIAATFGLSETPTVSSLIERVQGTYTMSQFVTDAVGALTSTGTFLFTALLYAAFLLSDWNDYPQKTRLALNDEESSDQALRTVRHINDRIGAYLSSKTLINVILGVISFAVMWIMGIEFAIFWAILIGLLNYIPYIGSVLGVMFPTALAVAQFGTIGYPALAFVALIAAQMFVGNVLEPRMLGKSVNMSPFVFLIALSFWMTVWGLIGAVLAIPLTSMIMIILAEIPRTRPIAVMMSGDGQV